MTLTRKLTMALAVLALVARAGEAQRLSREADPDGQFNSLPMERYVWYHETRAEPLGYVPTGALFRAEEQTAAYMASRRGVPAKLAATAWVPLGAAPLHGGQIGTTAPTRDMSGRVQTIAVDPGNASHWLIGAAGGGIWETTDAGVTWAPRSDDMPSLAMGAIAFAPGSPTTVLAGTGEAAFAADSFGGGGVLKSTNGGSSWSVLATADFAGNSISDIKIDPANADTFLVGTTSGAAGRVAVTPPTAPARGIYRTTNGGTSFSRVLDGDVTDIEANPANFSQQYAGVGNPTPTGTNGVFRSTDGGATWSVISGPWTSITGGIGRVELAIAPSDTSTLYVSIQDGFDGAGNDGGLLGLWKTTNAWDPTPTFSLIDTSATGTGGYCGWDAAFASPSNQCWYSHALIVDPTNASVIYAGGVPEWKFNGTSWTEVSKTVADPTNGIHVDQHALAWAGSRLIAGNDGGVWSTTDGGATWTDHNTNLAISQYYDGSLHLKRDFDLFIAGAQDNGTHIRTVAGTGWDLLTGGDGADNTISAVDPDNDWGLSTQRLNIIRTIDGGATGQTTSGINRTGVPFIARFDNCPTNPDICIAGTDNLWRSNNFFQAGTPTFATNGPEMTQGLGALAFAPSDTTCGTYAFGARASTAIANNRGALRVTIDGGTNWTDWDASNQVPERGITDIAFDPSNPSIAYVTLSGFDEATPGFPGHVFRTTNALSGSATWTDISPPANLPANSIVVDPRTPATLYLATDQGVWYSTDSGTTWTHWGPADGMPNVAVFELNMDRLGERLVAFTHGRSAFILSDLIFADGFETGSLGGWPVHVP
ncbi:MAG TPA: hypothetical protein PK413_01835 [Thermoanaerobaculia bacterium]|nr:hypothetical protein [Thermoanaerobaculia bacterium]